MIVYNVSLFQNLFFVDQKALYFDGTYSDRERARGKSTPWLPFPCPPDAFSVGAQQRQSLRPVAWIRIRASLNRHFDLMAKVPVTALYFHNGPLAATPHHNTYILRLACSDAKPLNNLRSTGQRLWPQRKKIILRICLYSSSFGHFAMCYILLITTIELSVSS